MKYCNKGCWLWWKGLPNDYCNSLYKIDLRVFYDQSGHLSIRSPVNSTSGSFNRRLIWCPINSVFQSDFAPIRSLVNSFFDRSGLQLIWFPVNPISCYPPILLTRPGKKIKDKLVRRSKGNSTGWWRIYWRIYGI